MRAWIFLLLLLVPAYAQTCNDPCWADKARKAELPLLKPGLAERRGNQLMIVTGAGSQLFNDDKKACDEDNTRHCAIYALVARTTDSFAIQKFEYEGSDSYLIDARSGRRTKLTGVPVFSIDGRKFLITQFSNDSDNDLEVWQRNGDSAKLEWGHNFEQLFSEDFSRVHGPAPLINVINWNGDHATLAISTDDQRYKWSGSLTRDTKGWHLAINPPPGLLPVK